MNNTEVVEEGEEQRGVGEEIMRGRGERGEEKKGVLRTREE